MAPYGLASPKSGSTRAFAPGASSPDLAGRPFAACIRSSLSSTTPVVVKGSIERDGSRCVGPTLDAARYLRARTLQDASLCRARIAWLAGSAAPGSAGCPSPRRVQADRNARHGRLTDYARHGASRSPRNVFDIWFSPFTNFLRNWDYKPVTSWFEHFITINWNSNDADVEQHVLGEVGSYGLQLSRILDAVDLLVSEARPRPAHPRAAAHRGAPRRPPRRRPPGRQRVPRPHRLRSAVYRRRDAPAGHRHQLTALASLRRS